jgi:murein L,D-transpeptidase YcbB/YkuD
MRCLAFLAALALLGCAQPAPVRPLDPAPAEAPAPDPAAEHAADLAAVGVSFRPPAEGKAILVNIPAFEAIAYEDGLPQFRSRVIVGKPATPTPVVDTATSVVRFRPTWRPTPSMLASGEYEDKVWPPGRRNPLGLAAIRLEPGMLVYLHDTNRRDLFERERRALSHGCIRLEEWERMTAWLLDAEPSQIAAWAEGRRTFDAEAAGVPVYLRYYTRFPNAEGVVVEHADIYGRDRQMSRRAEAPTQEAPAPL